jgi:hypothetical protein
MTIWASGKTLTCWSRCNLTKFDQWSILHTDGGSNDGIVNKSPLSQAVFANDLTIKITNSACVAEMKQCGLTCPWSVLG